MALLEHFNIDAAVATTALYVAAAFLLQLGFWDAVPAVTKLEFDSFIDGHPGEEGGMCCGIGAAVVFVAAFLNFHRFERPEKFGFLDIACINQSDASLKAKGIHSLGAVLGTRTLCRIHSRPSRPTRHNPRCPTLTRRPVSWQIGRRR